LDILVKEIDVYKNKRKKELFEYMKSEGIELE
jgi:hypothetical protein